MRKMREWETAEEEDPSAGMLNLFDLWIVFSVSLLLALVGALHAQASAPDASASAAPAREKLAEAFKKATHFRPTQSPLTGNGMRLGVAYQLGNGEVVYVPDKDN